MKNKRMSWILLLMLVWVEQSLQQFCSGISDCTCVAMPPDEQQIRCPKNSDSVFIIETKFGQVATMKCNRNPSWSDFKLQPPSEIQDVAIFLFERCLLPENKTLHDITRMIGVQPINRLRFESYANLSSTFEQRHLSGFPNLTRLSLSSNGLTEVPVDLLKDLPELTVLELGGNNVNLPVGFFDSVPKLKLIELGNNKLTHIDPLLFRNLSKLNWLGLWGNELTDIEEHTFDGLTGLNMLDISRNKLTTLPPDILKSLQNLTTLSIVSNHFSSLPVGLLSNNVNLKKFYLENNRGTLRTLPSRFLSNLPKLGDVHLRRNNLDDLPEDIFWGSSTLENLTLQGNLLSTLPKDIFKESKNLGILNLSANKFNNLPTGIFQALSKLVKLDLSKNNLTSIPRQLFSGLGSLKEIILEHNGIRDIDPLSFFSLSELQVARLSHNYITLESELFASFNSEYGLSSPFSNCKHLRKLYLSYNNISSIFSDWRISLVQLRELDLKYNKLSNIRDADLQFLSLDIEIDMRHNNIRNILLMETELMATSYNHTVSRTVRILVEDNPISCNCNLYFFLKYIEGRMHPDVQQMFHIIPGNLICNGPEFMDKIPVTELKSQTLVCERMDCPTNCTCWNRPDDRVVIANCSYRNLTTAPESIDTNEEITVELDLTGNFLTEVPSFEQSGYGDITKLLLSRNNISKISLDSVSLTYEVLDLHDNNLMQIDSIVLERLKNSTSLKELKLHGNPWRCNCEARDFLSFIQTKYDKIPEILNVTCESSNKPISEMTASDLCPVAIVMIVGLSFGIALLGLLIGALAALYYRYQAEIKVWLFAHQMCLWFVTEEELDKDKLYDAFISYSHQDEDFVVNELVPKLEQGPKPFKLCLHFRDWIAGEWIPQQIARSVEDSRRTIVILSPNFLESIWGRMEFRTAHSQALSEGRARVIVILLGDVGPTDNLDPELKAYLSMNTYVEWGDPWFWDKLRYALPHPPKVKQNNAKKIFENQQHHIKISGDKNGLINPTGVPPTPPAVTTPPADTLKTFTTNGSLQNGVLITDCLKNGMVNFDNIDSTQKQIDYDKNLINGQCTPV